MMRSLAAYIMRGRVQAVLMTWLGIWMPLIGQGAVALVALRRGMADGLWLLFWAILPYVVFIVLDGGLMLNLGSMAVLLVTLMAAIPLRNGWGWEYALVVAVLLSLSCGICLGQFAQADLAQLRELLQESLAEFAKQSGEGISITDQSLDQLILGAIGTSIGYSAVCGLLLGRWWQSLLYNPGGFGAEFKALRLGRVLAVSAAVLGGSVWYRGGGESVWAVLLWMPLLIAGFASLHARIAKKENGQRLLSMWVVSHSHRFR